MESSSTMYLEDDRDGTDFRIYLFLCGLSNKSSLQKRPSKLFTGSRQCLGYRLQKAKGEDRLQLIQHTQIRVQNLGTGMEATNLLGERCPGINTVTCNFTSNAICITFKNNSVPINGERHYKYRKWINNFFFSEIDRFPALLQIIHY